MHISGITLAHRILWLPIWNSMHSVQLCVAMRFLIILSVWSAYQSKCIFILNFMMSKTYLHGYIYASSWRVTHTFCELFLIYTSIFFFATVPHMNFMQYNSDEALVRALGVTISNVFYTKSAAIIVFKFFEGYDWPWSTLNLPIAWVGMMWTLHSSIANSKQ